jgi:4-oxalocrotonate tautomerase
MPLVNVKVIEGVFTPSQKQEMVRKLTWVVVEEVKSGDWGIGGKPLSTGDVKSLAAGKSG